MPLLSESYRTWERETREASLRGLEGLLPPPAEWPSFLDRLAASGSADDSFDYPTPVALPEVETEPVQTGPEAPAGREPASAAGKTSAAPAPAPAPRRPGKPGKQAEESSQAGGMQELPESLLPDSLREEIEDFLNKDRPAPASEEEIENYLKGGIDPNIDPEEES